MTEVEYLAISEEAMSVIRTRSTAGGYQAPVNAAMIGEAISVALKKYDELKTAEMAAAARKEV